MVIHTIDVLILSVSNGTLNTDVYFACEPDKGQLQSVEGGGAPLKPLTFSAVTVLQIFCLLRGEGATTFPQKIP